MASIVEAISQSTKDRYIRRRLRLLVSFSIFIGCALIATTLLAQNADEKASQRTKLGTLVPKSEPTPLRTAPTLAADSTVLAAIRTAHNATRLEQMDFIGEGSVTLETAEGPRVIPISVVRNGQHGQRIVFRQSDGKSWDGSIDRLEPLSRRVLEVVQTQYARGLPQLLKSSESVDIYDSGIKDEVQRLTLREATGVSSRYTIDLTTGLLRRLDFDRGETTDSTGKSVLRTESYLYSDFRLINGIATPFKVEHYSNGVKQEELRYTKVQYVDAPKPTPLPRKGAR